jgi:hypothetical protein
MRIIEVAAVNTYRVTWAELPLSWVNAPAWVLR